MVVYYNKKHTLVKNDNYEMMIVKAVLFLYLLFLVIIKIKLGFVFIIITVVVYCYLQSKKYENMTINISSDLIKSDVEIKRDDEKQTNTVPTIILSSDKYFKNKLIPKNIIQVWKTWSNKIPEMFSSNIKLLKKKTPDYTYMLFKDAMIDDFFIENYPDYFKTYNKLPTNIQKVDFCRYVLLYHYGGFYFDMDIKMLEPLDDSLLTNECVFPVDEFINKNECEGDIRFDYFCGKIDILLGQYGFACSIKSPFMKQLIDSIHNNVDKYITSYKSIKNIEYFVYKTTGPDFVTKEYIEYNNKKDIKILTYKERQHFGKYAKHDYIGTWKV